jgi:hypothetical protein
MDINNPQRKDVQTTASAWTPRLAQPALCNHRPQNPLMFRHRGAWQCKSLATIWARRTMKKRRRRTAALAAVYATASLLSHNQIPKEETAEGYPGASVENAAM